MGIDPLSDGDSTEEIFALVRQLHETQKRLSELTGGEVDAVVHPEGQSYLLQEAQEKLRLSEARPCSHRAVNNHQRRTEVLRRLHRHHLDLHHLTITTF